ncbi:MAG: diguanylate cyclase, partial [Oscillospiraceae bacterium]|nr:diguanylate cyclase [Oscillospiraceae bacterium]
MKLGNRIGRINQVCQPLYLIMVGMLIVMIFLVGIFGSDVHKYYNNSETELTEWHDRSGDPLDIGSLPSSDTEIFCDVQEIDFRTLRLCFKSVDTTFSVYADSDLVYDYDPQYPAIYGKSYGMYLHAVTIPAHTKTIRIEAHPIFDNQICFREVRAMDGAAFMAETYKQGMPGFCFCLIMASFGVVLIIVNLIRNLQLHSRETEFITLGSFALLMALWSMNDTYIPQLLTQNPALIRIVNYVSLILVPYPGLSFIATATNRPNSRSLVAILIAIGVNLGVTLTLTVTGASDFHDLVMISQALCVLAIGISFFMIARAFHLKNVEQRFMNILLISASAMAFGALADIARFLTGMTNLFGFGFFTQMGAMIFLVLVGFHLLQQYTQMRLDKDRAEVKAQLAYMDGLTNMRNRLAFNEKEKELQNSPICMIVQLDINFLKTVNDVYGHQEG